MKNKMGRWAEKNKFLVNLTKSEKCGREGNGDGFEDAGKGNRHKETSALFGVIIGQGLSFEEQVGKVVKKMDTKMKVLSALAGKDSSWSRKELKTIYKVCVESAVWYAAAAWMPWLSTSRFNVLESAQQKALRIVYGLTNTAPKICMLEEVKVLPFRVEVRRRAMICYEKAMRCEEICERQVDKRFKANKGWREQAKKATDELRLRLREGEVYERIEPWQDVKDGGLLLNVDLVRKKSKEMAEGLCKAVVEESVEKYDSWIKVYTDGSVEGGVACVASVSGDKVVRRKAVGKWCSSYEWRR